VAAPDVDALFVPDGGSFVPTEYARGPWSPDSLHGGPVAALLVGEVERTAAGDGRHLVRLTLDLLRPVPLAPLTVTWSTPRGGRRVQLVDGVLSAGDVEVALARVVRILGHPGGAAPATAVREDDPPAGPETGIDSTLRMGAYRAFHNEGMVIRFVEGRFDQRGPATAWFRLAHPVVAGQVPSPWQRVAAAADFANGVARELDFAPGVLFINPDLTVSVHRPPEGEWVCLDARTRFGVPGVGATEAALWDRRGRIGRAVQSLVVEVGG
jgi:hypothetical protein